MTDFTGGPGFLAFVFTFALAVAGVLLFRSLAKHLRKVRGASSTSSDLREPGAAQAGGDGTMRQVEPGADGAGDEAGPGDQPAS
ncbi:hypothetical protein [Demequina salsinemoris]|uniref:hypothetical protein n=1 Tax=Demequina salsinemoris TaxID=577470 RepID=UPI0007808DA5|nr:hypothetical protein [Demequina salsinemoris]